MGSQKRRGGKREFTDDFDQDKIKGNKKTHKSQRVNKEERAIQTELEMQEVPADRDEIIALIKEGNDFYGDCNCGIPLTVHKAITTKGDMEYSFSCSKCNGKWTLEDLLG